MNLNEIKDIIEKDGGKIIIVENDKPTMVVMSFDEYKGNLGRQKNNPGSSIIQPQPEAKAEQKFTQEMRDEEPEELTIDDLPL